MNSKKLFAALLALVMVVSMMTIVAMPANAMTQTEAEALPLASTATAGDGVTAYQINSVDELLNASIASGTTNPTANTSTIYDDGDTIYITADLNVSTWDPSNFATYDAGTGKYTTKGNWVANPNKTSYMIFSTSEAGAECDNAQEVFAYLYNGFNARNAYYTYIYADFDGLGHTITGFYAYCSFLTGDTYSTISNLTFKNATVDATSAKKAAVWTSNAPAIVTRSASASGCAMDNVHLVDCYSKGATANYQGAFMSLASNNNRPLTMTNCSMVGTTVETTNPDMDMRLALAVGDYRTTATFTLDNFIAYNCKIVQPGNTATAQNRGMLFCTTSKNPELALNNVAIIDCTREFTANGALIGENAAVAALTSLTGTTTAINNVFFTGNKVDYKDAEGNPLSEPINVAIRDYTNKAVALEAVTNSRYVTDDMNALSIVGTESAYGASVYTPALTMNTVLAEMNGLAPDGHKWALVDGEPVATATAPVSYLVRFVGETFETVLASDSTGKVTVDAETKALLSSTSWSENATPVVLDFDNLVVNANTEYVFVGHTSHIEAIPGDNANHKVVCDNCSEANHNYTVTCADVTVNGTPVAGDYYTAAQTTYTCECGNTWNVEDTSAPAPEAPITVTLDAASYSGTGAAVKVALGAKADANLNAYTATVTFDPAKLAYVDYSAAFNCVVDDSNKANGTLTVAFTQAAGQILNTEAMTLNFQTVNVTVDSTVEVTAQVTDAIVDTGSECVSKMPITTTASDSAAVVYVVVEPAPIFTAGDVNNDGLNNLLDAVLVNQKLNGTIYAAQDATFQIWAADVDGDAAVTTSDVTVLLRKALRDDTVLTAATSKPALLPIA